MGPRKIKYCLFLTEECKAKPAALKPGQTVFFVIQPRFMNVDIRVIIDVTQGELDVFMSPHDDSFIVLTNETTGQHDIFLDNRYNWGPKIKRQHALNVAVPKPPDNLTMSRLVMSVTHKHNGIYAPQMPNCKTHTGNYFYVKDKHAKDLSTHVTLNQCNTLLRLFGLKNRLVLTLPQNAHNLSATRFFIALRAANGPEPSYGSVVFRQDQLHIDLFVFFSVFFSCFFLFLAVCVVVWKVKQAADLRRARRQHVVEMLHLAKRPFARVYLTTGAINDRESPQATPSGRLVRSVTGARSRYHIVGGSSHAQTELLLVAIEPTFDNLAAVGTVFVSLPGRHKAPLNLSLGSALITYPRQFPLNSRNFLRTQRANIPSNLIPMMPLGGGDNRVGVANIN